MLAYLRKRWKSFGYAGKGLAYLLRHEAQFQVHLVITVWVVLLGYSFHISVVEWALVFLAIGMVLTAEALNTALEQFVNWISPEKRAEAGKVKDIAAGAVLLASLGAFAVGIMVFLPKIWIFCLF